MHGCGALSQSAYAIRTNLAVSLMSENYETAFPKFENPHKQSSLQS